jgi:predicted GNAT family acetyltransferase
MNLEMLDNPIWHALATYQKDFAIYNAHAKMLPTELGRFGAIESATPENLEGLTQLLSANNATIAWFAPEKLEFPEHLELLTTLEVRQMICQNLKPSPKLEAQKLTLEDVPAMLELVELTKPGPFARRTIEMGRFWGIRVNQQLVAMTGERLHLPGYCEVSAVCTHPDYRGRGFAQALITKVAQDIIARGEIPFLHVMKPNNKAARVYEQLGFVERQQLHGYVLRTKSPEVKS